MSKFSWLAAAAVTALAACAGTQDTETQASAASAVQTPAPQTAPMTSPPAATPATPATYTDAQLRSFAAAAREINPLNAQVATATPEQRAALVVQIRDILARNNIDSATYNAIASQAQADPALATRIAGLNVTTPPPG